MSSSPEATRAGARLPRNPPRWRRPFSIEADLDVGQNHAAGSCAGILNNYWHTFEGQLAAGDAVEEAAVYVVAATGTGPARHRLLNPFPRFAELVLKLLDAPELVELTVRTDVLIGKAGPKALVSASPVRDSGEQDLRASTLRMLFAEASSAAFRRRQRERTRPSTSPAVEPPPDLVQRERKRPSSTACRGRQREGPSTTPAVDLPPDLVQQERKRPSTTPAAELPPDVMRMVVGKLPWKETFGAARGVSKTWRDAVDSVSPPNSFRRRVLEGTLRGWAPARGVARGRGAEAGGGASCPAEDRGLLPTVSWLRDSRFDESSGEEVMALLEAGLGWLKRESLEEEELAFRRAAVGDGEIDANGSEGTARIRWRRLRGFLPGIRAFCEERGISCGAAHGTGAAVTEETGRTAGVHTSAAPVGERRLDEAAVAAAARISPPSSSKHDHRWDGWLVLAAAVALAASEDRSFLCRCALQSVFGTNGLPRTPMIELLCRMHVAVRPPAARAVRRRGIGFQAASSVSTAETWNGKGSYRLRYDLLLCIFALEGYCVRFPSAQDTTTKGNHPPSRMSQSSNLSSQRTSRPNPRWVDESMLTSEQREVVDTKVGIGQVLRIVAYAGTGKTFTLRAVAQRNHTLKKTLYLAFNRSVAAAARPIFSTKTECRTMSSVSMSGTGRAWGKISRNLTKEIWEFLKATEGTTPYSHAKFVYKTIDVFFSSSDPTITGTHVPNLQPLSQTTGSQVMPPAKAWVLATAKRVWRTMHPPPSNGEGVAEDAPPPSNEIPGSRIPPTFASITKVYQLSKPDLSSRYDMIMVDEAQDINPCEADIIERQTKCRVIVVGDPHQAIYGFRGAKDYLEQARCLKTLYLTQVFRFPNPIASVANTVLLGLKQERRPLLGSLASPDGPTKVMFERERHEWLQQDSKSKGRFAYIARTNAALMMEAVAAVGRGDRAAFIGGTEEYLKKVNDLCYMMMGEVTKVKHPELKEIGSIPALREVLDNETDDQDMRTIAALVEKLGLAVAERKKGNAQEEERREAPHTQPVEMRCLLSMVDDYISAGKTPHQVLADMEVVKSMRLDANSKGPLMILTTVHKAKGLEYDTVVLADDFSFEPVNGSSPLHKSATENANLLYVAVTRAKRQLILNKKLARQVRYFGMWDSLALQGTTTTLCPAAGPVPCCTERCDCLDAHGVAAAVDDLDPASVNGGGGGGAGSSQQRPRLLFGGSGSGGPLCQACVEGLGGNSGAFPYFSWEFGASSSESSAAVEVGAA